MLPKNLRLLLVVVHALGLGACGAPPSAKSRGHPPDPGSAPACAATVVEEHYLETADGLQLYVEPRFVDTVGETVFVAGTPTYAWTVTGGNRAEGLQATEAPGEPFFGALFDRSTARSIALPPGVGAVRWVYGTKLPAGRHGFIMEEVESPAREAPHRSIRYAQLGPFGWEAVEELTGPEEGRLLFGIASTPTSDRGEVVWSVVHSRDARLSLATYRRTRKGWQGPDVLGVSSNTVAMLAPRSGRSRVVIAGLDPATEHVRSSLRIHHVATSSSEARAKRVAIVWTAEPGEQLHGLLTAQTRGGAQAAWISRGGGRAGAWALSLEPPYGRQPTLVDAEASSLALIGRRGGWAYWLTSSSDSVSGAPRLRLHRTSAHVSQRIADLPSPFIGLSSGTLSPSGEIVVIGPEAHFETTPPFVRSLVLRFSLNCDS